MQEHKDADPKTSGQYNDTIQLTVSVTLSANEKSITYQMLRKLTMTYERHP